eukprot:scaffold22454_cov58-Cyclotella_meneghiniana.AAC.5
MMFDPVLLTHVYSRRYIATSITLSLLLLIHHSDGSVEANLRNPPLRRVAPVSPLRERGLQNDTASLISPEVQSPLFPSPDSNTPISPPNSTCIDTPDWKDLYGNGCDWYGELDERCTEFSNWYEGTMGAASDNCCHCGRVGQVNDISMNFTLANSSAPSPSSITISDDISDDLLSLDTSPSICYDTYNWTDSFGDGCDWYESNDDPGCPEYGDWSSANYTEEAANDNCCYCGGGSENPNPTVSPTISGAPSSSSPTVSPTISEAPSSSSAPTTCKDTPGWYDYWGWDCSWYEVMDDPGCPKYGDGNHLDYDDDDFDYYVDDNSVDDDDYDVEMGVANDNCCHCKNAITHSVVSVPVDVI